MEEYVARFQDVFAEKVFTQKDVSRLHEPLSTAGSQVIYPFNPDLKLAEDVLTNGLLWAKCDVLIHRVSNNRHKAAGYINPSISMIYCRSLIKCLRQMLALHMLF